MTIQPAVIRGRRWRVSRNALSGLVDDKRWGEWTERPGGEPLDAAAAVFASVADAEFDTEQAILAAVEGIDAPTPVKRALVDAAYECLASMPTPNDPSVQLYRGLNGGSKPHLPDCPHVRAIDLVAVRPEESASIPICASWCERELAGEGRTYHDTIAAALEDMGAPHHARAELERLLNTAEFDKIFVPNSRTYVAVTRAGKATAWAGKTYVGFTGAEPRIVYLPDYVTGGGGGTQRNERRGEICPIHGYEMSVTGVCMACE